MSQIKKLQDRFEKLADEKLGQLMAHMLAMVAEGIDADDEDDFEMTVSTKKAKGTGLKAVQVWVEDGCANVVYTFKDDLKDVNADRIDAALGDLTEPCEDVQIDADDGEIFVTFVVSLD